MDRVSIYFSVTCTETELGEDLYIAGSVPELGNWQWGLKLETDPDLYPQWKNRHPLLIEPETEFQFKACIKDSQGKIRKWEQLTHNRSVALFSPMQIAFQYSNPHMNFNVERSKVRTLPYRKVTMDNVQDIGEECRSASSGWQVFLDKMLEDEQMTHVNLINEAHFLYQNWKSESIGHSVIKKSVQKHFEILHLAFTHKNSAKILKESQDCEQIEYSSVEDIRKRLEDLTYSQLSAFHFALDKQSKKALLKLSLKSIGFVVVHASSQYCLQMEPEELDSMAEHVHLLVVNSYQALLRIVNIYQSLKYWITMQTENAFRVALGQTKFLIFYSHSTLSQCNKAKLPQQKQNNYFEQINKILTDDRYLSFPERYRVQRLLSECQTSMDQQNKPHIILVVHCQNITDFSIQTAVVLDKLAHLSNIQIYIATDNKPTAQEVKKIMPLNTQKLIVIDLNGEIHCSKNKWNLFKQLSVTQTAITTYYKLLQQKITQLFPATQAKITYENDIMSIVLTKNALTKMFLDWLQKQTARLSTKFSLPMQIKRMKSTEDPLNNLEYLQIKSVLMSVNFYCRIIASAIEHANLQNSASMYCLSFVNRSKFVKNMKKICEEKDIRIEDFEVILKGGSSQDIKAISAESSGETISSNVDGFGVDEEKLHAIFKKIEKLCS